MAAGETARRSPTCSAIIVPCEKPTSASADGGNCRRVSSASRKLLSAGAAWLTPAQRSPGSRNVSGNHSRPLGACPQGRGVAAHLLWAYYHAVKKRDVVPVQPPAKKPQAKKRKVRNG